MITSREREVIRDLAKKQLEVANSAKNQERIALWKRHNALKGERPVIHIEVDNFVKETIVPRMLCEDPVARWIEGRLRHSMINLTEFDDDKVVPDYLGIWVDRKYNPLGFQIHTHQAADGGLGHQFDHLIEDLGEEFDKIKNSEFQMKDDEFQEHFDTATDLIGDIMPVKRVMKSLFCPLTQDVVHIMGLENMLYALYDYPEELKKMIDLIADGYIAHHKMLERDGYLMPTTGFEETNQGSLSFTDELPDKGPVTVGEVWGFMDSQETVGVSHDMFEEIVWPAYWRLGQTFGLLSYGCCEPLDPVWDLVGQFPNLRKASVSAWANEEKMGEFLRGTKTIYQRKPSPNFLGVGETLNEDAWRGHIEHTLRCAAGCKLEMTVRDVYTIHNDISKVQRAVQIMRESIDRLWQA